LGSLLIGAQQQILLSTSKGSIKKRLHDVYEKYRIGQNFDCALHVNLYSSRALSIQNLMDEHGMTRSAPEKVVEKSDNQIKGFSKYPFHLDWNVQP
jgi:hypothetical protein